MGHSRLLFDVMLEDRDYMREQPGSGLFGQLPPVAAWVAILIANILVFLLGSALGPRAHEALITYGALSLDGLKHGYVWQFLSYQFLHGGLGHILLNSIALVSFGRVLEMQLGRLSFTCLYFLSGIAGGALQILLAAVWAGYDAPVVGASAGICGLVAALSLLHPDSIVQAFFVIPMRAIYFLPLVIAISVLCLIFRVGEGVAHGAHLGGILLGIAWIRFGWHRYFELSSGEGFFERLRGWRPMKSRHRKRELVRAASLRDSAWRNAPADSPAELPAEEFISKEVDPILDKISAHGIQSLTERERKILEAARKRMSKR